MIEAYRFGKIVVDGVAYRNDIKIVQGRVVSDWWRSSGHEVCRDDVADILAAEPNILVVGKGNPGFLRVAPDLKAHLVKKGIQLIETKTKKAVNLFNRLAAEGIDVAAGFHLTC